MTATESLRQLGDFGLGAYPLVEFDKLLGMNLLKIGVVEHARYFEVSLGKTLKDIAEVTAAAVHLFYRESGFRVVEARNAVGPGGVAFRRSLHGRKPGAPYPLTLIGFGFLLVVPREQPSGIARNVVNGSEAVLFAPGRRPGGSGPQKERLAYGRDDSQRNLRLDCLPRGDIRDSHGTFEVEPGAKNIGREVAGRRVEYLVVTELPALSRDGDQLVVRFHDISHGAAPYSS